MATSRQTIHLNEKRQRRARRVRVNARGTQTRPRLSIFRSNRHFYAQIIDDMSGKTLFGRSDAIMKGKMSNSKAKARQFGELFAKSVQEQGISKVVFDRSHYAYHGRVREFAEGARAGGLKF